jgi:hypothetical protein
MTAVPTQPQIIMSDLCATMDDIVRIVEQETALVRAGSLAEASALQPAKTELANRYYAGTSQIKAMLPALQSGQQQALADLKRKHDEFRALLQINLTVLATAHPAGPMRRARAQHSRWRSAACFEERDSNRIVKCKRAGLPYFLTAS